MLEADDSLPDMTVITYDDEDGKSSFPYLSKLDYDKVSDYFLAFSSEGKADEIAVIELKKTADSAQAKKSLDDHIQKRINTYTQYEPSEVPRVEKAKVLVRGRYVAIVICNDERAVSKVFEEALSK